MVRDGEKRSPQALGKSLYTGLPVAGDGWPIIVLTEPQLGENIGAAARAMLNFGLTGLRLVKPRDGWPNAQAGAMAAGAGQVLDAAQLYASVTEAVADCHYVLATTARHRDLALPVITPQAAAQSLVTRIAAGARTAILFGGERSGLSSEDVAKSQAIIKIPVNPDFSSLNLAQAVLVIAYEWSKAALSIEGRPNFSQPGSGASDSAPSSAARPAPAQPPAAQPRTFQPNTIQPCFLPSPVAMTPDPVAPAGDQTALLTHLFEALEAGGFFHPPEKIKLMQRNIEVMIRRAQLSKQEVRTFRGMIKALVRGRGR